MPRPRAEMREALRSAVNANGWDSRAETPDFVLAEYLVTCLEAYLAAQSVRAFHYVVPRGTTVRREDLTVEPGQVLPVGTERLYVALPMLEHPGLADLPALAARLEGWIGDLAPTSPHQQMREDLEACRTMTKIMENLRRPREPVEVPLHGPGRAFVTEDGLLTVEPGGGSASGGGTGDPLNGRTSRG